MGNNKYKVLIVEDDQSILGFVQTILETNGYQVLTAERCRQGLLIFSSYTPDLVVLDLGLPDMDGGEFIRQVRLFSTVPIIVLSARTEENDKVSALDLGANDYITKALRDGGAACADAGGASRQPEPDAGRALQPVHRGRSGHRL